MTVIGTVNLRSFDSGVLALLEPELVTLTIDNAVRQKYAVPVAGVFSGVEGLGGRVPVWYMNPEDVYTPQWLPCFRIAQPDMTPAFQRQPWYEVVGSAPAPDAIEVVLPDGRRGWSAYETQWRATPFDLTYDITILGRRHEDAQRMLLHVLRRAKAPWFPVPVFDSKGEQRYYDAGDMAVSDVSEIVDIADRAIGWTVSFTVRAELDLDDTTVGTAFTGASALDPWDPLYGRFDLILRTHAGVNPATW